jgi:succinylarginine dihydrolase
MSFEANFDGLVGPTHHYAGLSVGNIASTRNAKLVSHPKKAALQGLAKAAMLRDLGLRQGVLPPLRRPRLDTLRELGFSGSDSSVIERAFRAVPQLLSACYSASSMWVANSATFSPSADSEDGLAHFTAANLSSKFHRSLEPKQTATNLRRIFAGERFVHHDPVIPQFGDEGAANHGRLAPVHGKPGIEVFVFGGSVLQDATFLRPKKFPARQTIEASQAIATHHRISAKGFALLQQNPDAIDAGVFHNDVVSVMNENLFFTHEKAFLEQPVALARLRETWNSHFREGDGSPDDLPLEIVEISEKDVPLEDAVRGYLFNSQLVTLPAAGAVPARMALICPEECRETESVRKAIDSILADGKNPIREAHYLDVRESMQNGGGPACLRLRVVLTEEEAADVHPGVWLTKEREASLQAWIGRHYRDRLSFDDLRDPKLFLEVQAAMDDLEKLMGFPLA